MTRKIILWIVFGGMAVLMVIGFVMKDSMNRYISGLMKLEVTPDIENIGKSMVDSLYNYSKNGLSYEVTLLEFGSTGCVICKKMEPVLDEIRINEKINTNVVFLHIMKQENLPLMKYYGISAVPMQILLDKEGIEFFRNYGFISAEDLIGKAMEINNNHS